MAPSPPETSSAASRETSNKSSVPPKTSTEGAETASPPAPAPAVAKENGEEKVSVITLHVFNIDVLEKVTNELVKSAEPDNMWEVIDKETLEQILDLDEDDHEFSRGMAWAYFEQVNTTFEEMDAA